MKHILCIQICKLFAALLEMESLAPETRGCRFQWEADQLKFHSRFLHLCHISARLFLFIHPCSSQPSRWYWWLSRPIFPCLFILCLSSHFFSLFISFSPPRVCPAPATPITPITPITPVIRCHPRQPLSPPPCQPRFLIFQCEMSTVVR